VIAGVLTSLLGRGLRHYAGPGKVALWQRAAKGLPSGSHTIRLSSGGRMSIDTSRYWQRLMYAEAFERRSAWLVHRLLSRGEVFIDGGANCGFYSCLAAGAVGPEGRVLAVEPDTRLLSQLHHQMVINAPVIEIVPAALSNVVGKAAFQIPPDDIPDGWGLGVASLERHDDWASVTVSTTTLDKICAAQTRPVSLAKLDLEGHEGQAIAGAATALATGRLESLVVEINDRRTIEALRATTFDLILDIRRGFTEVSDVGTLDGSHTDIALLRGRAAERWRRLRWRARLL
jgi:FkbM family methyltransferase